MTKDHGAWFGGFDEHRLRVGEVTLRVRTGGAADAPPLLLLHGFPQTHVMWHPVARLLAPHFRLVLPDLRGYGDSDKPDGGPDHAGYSKRAMAADMAGLMAQLGHTRYAVCGHDRGGRVAHRLALDHPQALADYERCFCTPEAIHAACEDYRAAAGIDLEHDRASRATGQRIACDLLVLWGERGVVQRMFDPLALWQAQCSGRVEGRALPCGHFIPEECPQETAQALIRFLG